MRSGAGAENARKRWQKRTAALTTERLMHFRPASTMIGFRATSSVVIVSVSGYTDPALVATPSFLTIVAMARLTAAVILAPFSQVASATGDSDQALAVRFDRFTAVRAAGRHLGEEPRLEAALPALQRQARADPLARPGSNYHSATALRTGLPL